MNDYHESLSFSDMWEAFLEEMRALPRFGEVTVRRSSKERLQTMAREILANSTTEWLPPSEEESSNS